MKPQGRRRPTEETLYLTDAVRGAAESESEAEAKVDGKTMGKFSVQSDLIFREQFAGVGDSKGVTIQTTLTVTRQTTRVFQKHYATADTTHAMDYYVSSLLSVASGFSIFNKWNHLDAMSVNKTHLLLKLPLDVGEGCLNDEGCNKMKPLKLRSEIALDD
ncbi:hypothetical protein Tco_0122092 [Tanacetum coccineum]